MEDIQSSLTGRKDFCPAHSDVAAINKLESTSYYQESRSINNYLDEFMELIAEAGYTDPNSVAKVWFCTKV